MTATREDRWRKETKCANCGGKVVSYGGIDDYGGSHHGEVWGGSCGTCGVGYGEEPDNPELMAKYQARKRHEETQ